MIPEMLEYYNLLRQRSINIIYGGPLWADAIDSIAGTLKRRLELDELPLSSSQSVFSVFVEQMNNMLMYSAEKECSSEHHAISNGIFILGVKDKTYFMQSGNVMKSDSVELVKSRIDYLNSLDKKELRQFYRERLRAENTNPESRGAGVGLIEIARRASSKIEYAFEPYGDGFTFFTMFVTIGQEGI